MGSFTKREQIVILLIVFIIILALGFKFFIKDIIESKGNTMEVISTDQLIDTESIEEPHIIEGNNIIMVHISGQVYNPGLVELELGDRVIDAVKLAGGLKKDADMDRINLAKKLVDEEKIYIPKVGEEISNDLDNESSVSYKEESGKININTCSKEELVALPGIGEAIANRIIEYRSTSPFKSIEDIKNVSGIGEKKFMGIKELIIVN